MSDVINTLRDLHPVALASFVKLYYDLAEAHETGRIGQLFLPFETYRTPSRQTELLSNGKGVTQAGAWQSAHQYGLAVDFVPFLMKGPTRGWNWGHTNQWDVLKQLAKARGLTVPYEWDRAHVVHPLWLKINKLISAEPKESMIGAKIP